jgi:signal transduction histidine kinase
MRGDGEDASGRTAPAEPVPSLDAAAALAGSVAHDLGNMLTVVLGNAELLVEGLGEQPELAELAGLILSAAQRGTELTGRLDRFARRIPPPPVPADTAGLLATFARRLVPGLPPGIRFEMVVAPDLGQVAVPDAALHAALDEIVANALAALAGQGRLRILAANHATPAGEPRLRLVVEDEGVGMDPETLRRTRQAGFTSGVAGHKTGLGLALAMRVALAGGGRLLIDSTPGQGTRVTLDLVAVS